MMIGYLKPPLGVMPKWLWLEKRRDELISCIKRHTDQFWPIGTELIDEYNEIVNQLKTAYPTYISGTWGKL